MSPKNSLIKSTIEVPKEGGQIEDFFDVGFYLEQVRDLVPEDALSHYQSVGWKAGLDPSPGFSAKSYLSDNKDVREGGIDPFEHYLKYGHKERREISPSSRIDPAVVHLTQGGEVDRSIAGAILRSFQPSQASAGGVASIQDYLKSDWRTWRASAVHDIGQSRRTNNKAETAYAEADVASLRAAFDDLLNDEPMIEAIEAVADKEWYARNCEALGVLTPVQLGMDVVTHNILIGRHFRLSVTPLFDVVLYTAVAQQAGFNQVGPETALIHYLRVGEGEGLRPCALFNPGYYRERYDVEGSALAHYTSQGAAEGCQPSSAFWTDWYCETYKVHAANPLVHFYCYGLVEAFLPNPLVSIDWYGKQNKLKSGIAALEHYLSTGLVSDLSPHILIDPMHIRQSARSAGLDRRRGETWVECYLRLATEIDPHILFDSIFYLSRLQNSDGVEQPLAHYLDKDVDDSKQPNPYFQDKTYVTSRPDVFAAGEFPLIHYCKDGHNEQLGYIHPLINHDALRESVQNIGNTSALQALMEDKAGEAVTVRKMVGTPDTENRSKWLPVALDIDGAAAPYADQSLDNVRVGVLAHVFYVELLPEVIAVAANMPQQSILLISTDSSSKREAIIRLLEESELTSWDVRVFENRGRDIAPSFFGFLDHLENIDYALHIHTKQSRHYGQSFDQWRHYLFGENGGSVDRVNAILRTFEANETLGALAPIDFGPIRKLISWGYDRPMAEALLELAGYQGSIGDISLEFPSGSMFWFRVKALKGLFDIGLQRHHFDPEGGQVDGTIAHAIERAFFLLVEANGFDWARFCSESSLYGYTVTDDIFYARSRLLPDPDHYSPIVQKLPETMPFFCRPIDNDRVRLNLLLPTADQQMGYAGVSEAIRQFRAVGERLGPDVDMRIISTDVAFNNMTIPPKGFAISETLVDDGSMIVVPGHLRATEPLGLRPNDVFVSSAWWSAKQAYNLMDIQAELFGDLGDRRLVYLIQDFEPGFYPWSTRFSMAENTYRHPNRTIAVFNTPLLADFMLKRYGFSVSQTFRPMINEKLLVPEEDCLPPDDREKIVLLYARPHAERNCLEMLDAVIDRCIQDNPSFWAGWRFLAIGETFKPEILHTDRIEVLGRLSLDEYRSYLAKAKLGVSIMVSPHPSYPPLEMAANGVKVLTNTYEDKDLSTIHDNIESFTLYDPAALAQQLEQMASEGGEVGQSKIDWFFDGGNNLAEVAETVASELRKDLGL